MYIVAGRARHGVSDVMPDVCLGMPSVGETWQGSDLHVDSRENSKKCASIIINFVAYAYSSTPRKFIGVPLRAAQVILQDLRCKVSRT